VQKIREARANYAKCNESTLSGNDDQNNDNQDEMAQQESGNK
jgi:hypothetical protein